MKATTAQSILTSIGCAPEIEDNPENPQMVLTVWGIGYKFTDEQ